MFLNFASCKALYLTLLLDSCYFSDPFADATKGADENVQDGFVHIRIQQRNGRKTLTTVQGLSSEYDLKKIVRACKKVSDHLVQVWEILGTIGSPVIFTIKFYDYALIIVDFVDLFVL